MRLSEMHIGDIGEIKKITATGEIRRRLLDMGLVSGTRFRVLRVAPLGDPIEIYVKGFLLSLRKEEAYDIVVDELGHMKGHKARVEARAHHTNHTYGVQNGHGKKKHGRRFRNRQRAFDDGMAPIPREENHTTKGRIEPIAQQPTQNAGKIINVALVGNPNCGKTSLFNELVGAHQKVGNWTGVTVERFEGEVVHKGYTIRIIDLPGTYSLTAYTPEEQVARSYLIDDKPDVVLNVVDSTTLERQLYLTTQLMELQANMLVALNMYDQLEKDNINIDKDVLQRLLGCHAVATSASQQIGIEKLKDHIVRVFTGEISVQKNKLIFSSGMESAIESITEIIEKDDELISEYNSRWLAIKLIEGDKEVYSILKELPIWIKIEKRLQDLFETLEKHSLSDPELTLTEDRHSFIRGAIQETVEFPKEKKRSLTDKIDAIVLNRFFGLPIFLFVMWGVFQLTFTLGEFPMMWIEQFFGWLQEVVTVGMKESLGRSLIVDGIISGVGGVLVFLPNILILFFSLSLLEASGYMSRASFVVDKLMHRIGLHGKSFIPMITGFGCSVPAIMACRTLKNRGDRLTTMMIIPFMSCGAKLPIYVLLIGLFFPTHLAGTSLFIIYFLGVVVAIISAKMLKSTIFKGKSEPFVMELPPYRFPKIKSLLYQVWHKAAMYLKKAATVILVASVVLWLGFNLPVNAPMEDTVVAKIGKVIEPIFKPLGFDWKMDVALISGLAAKEVVVSSLATLYSAGSDDWQQALVNASHVSMPVIFAFITFVLLYMPCLAATVVFRKESGEFKMTLFYMFFSMVTAWVWAFAVKLISSLFF